jgi:hypothetical protein
LGGNSKVLTFVNISPASYNLGETICSLNFASRCRSTELGQAKKQQASSLDTSMIMTDVPASAMKPSLSQKRTAIGGAMSGASSLSSGSSLANSAASLVSPRGKPA